MSSVVLWMQVFRDVLALEALFSSTVSEAACMVMAMRFGVCTLCIFSSSAHGMFRQYERTRRVDNLACVASCACLGQ